MLRQGKPSSWALPRRRSPTTAATATTTSPPTAQKGGAGRRVACGDDELNTVCTRPQGS